MKQNRKTIHIANFLFSLAIGLVLYINSSFISSFVGEKLVGVIYAIGSIVSILGILIAPSIFKKLGGYRFLLLITLLDALSFLGIALFNNVAILFFILGFGLNTLIVFSLDELLKIFSRNTDTGKIRGVYLTLGNLAVIASQLAIVTFMGEFSYRTIYFTAFLIMTFFLLVSYFNLKNTPEPDYDKLKTIAFVGKFFKNQKLRRAYGFSFLVNFFYSWMLIYTPIYLLKYLSFSLGEVSIIFTIMLIPFLFMPILMGKLSDKIGERKLLMFGFAVTSFSTLLLFIFSGKILWLWALLLFLTRVGISTTEAMSDTYFFKHIHPENEEFVGVYRSISPVANILGPIIAFGIFIFIPSFNFIFLILGALMLYGVYLSSTIKRGEI